MSINLPPIIQKYVDASNAHDVKAILSCFATDAVVHDEEQDFRGKKLIEDWIATTIEKYKYKFKPLGASNGDVEPVVAVEVSGTFPGSPATLDYHFKIDNNSISSLSID